MFPRFHGMMDSTGHRPDHKPLDVERHAVGNLDERRTENVMDDKPKRVRKPGPRSRWCTRCRRIKPKGKPRGGSWTREEAKAWAIAREARRKRLAEGHHGQ
jgi:hypothetical protein